MPSLEIETIVNQLDRPDEKTAEETKREEQVKKEQEEKNPHGQVVDIARPAMSSTGEFAERTTELNATKVARMNPRTPHRHTRESG